MENFPKPNKLLAIELILAKHMYVYRDLDIYFINSKGKIDINTILMDETMLSVLNTAILEYEKQYKMKFLDAVNRDHDFLFINKKAISKVYDFKDGDNVISDIHLSLCGQGMRVLSDAHPNVIKEQIKLESTI